MNFLNVSQQKPSQERETGLWVKTRNLDKIEARKDSFYLMSYFARIIVVLNNYSRHDKSSVFEIVMRILGIWSCFVSNIRAGMSIQCLRLDARGGTDYVIKPLTSTSTAVLPL